jgi:hypothetical protein
MNHLLKNDLGTLLKIHSMDLFEDTLNRIFGGGARSLCFDHPHQVNLVFFEV